jgi:fructose-1-phosphate kinase PfkB-like protein
MATDTKKKARFHVATRISEDAYVRLMKRVNRANKDAVLTNLGAVLRALIEEHA